MSTETDEQIERRLAREAQQHCGTLTHPDIPAKTGQTAVVEWSVVEEDGYQRAGRFTVVVPIDVDPWIESQELAIAELERRYPNAQAVEIDDIRSR